VALGLRVIETPGRAAIWGVAALLQAVSDALAARLSACRVRGEISAWTQAASGHCYFTLKDSDGAAASVRCVMFRRGASLLSFRPRDGQQVELLGRMAIYEPRGDMQLVAEAMQPLGAGALYEQFLKLKAKLQAEGLFDDGRKRALPRLPSRVGVVSSTAGAALHDVLTTLAQRSPWVQVIVYPSLVQGADAPAALVRALAQAAARQEVDVLIVARGGGSLEDLWAFNDEQVVRAVAAMPMPVISGVGHETDITLCDLAADVRAATPTAAAQQAAPALNEEMPNLLALARRLSTDMRHRLDASAQRLDQRALQLARPSTLLQQQARRLQDAAWRLREGQRSLLQTRKQALQHAAQALPTGAQRTVQSAAQRLAVLQGRLASLDPGRVLLRGYTWVIDDHGRAITSAAQVTTGQRIATRWHDGTASAQVDSVALDPDSSFSTSTQSSPPSRS
jgi:exodeoxyribonuclease VII large subunit